MAATHAGQCTAFSPDDSLLAVETGDCRVRLIDPATGIERVTLEDPNQDFVFYNPGAIAFSRDGERLFDVSLRSNRALHEWDLRALHEMLRELDLDWDQQTLPPRDPPDANLSFQLVVDQSGLPIPQTEVVAVQTAAIERNPNDGEAYAARAAALALLGKLHDALEDYTKAIRLQPDNLTYRKFRLVLAEQLFDHAILLDDLQKLHELEPDNLDWANYLAWRLTIGPEALRDPRRAVALAQLAVDKCMSAAERAAFLNTLGLAQYRDANYPAAIASLNESLALGGVELESYNQFGLAMCHARLGQNENARDHFDHAVHAFNARPPSALAMQRMELEELRAEARQVLPDDVRE